MQATDELAQVWIASVGHSKAGHATRSPWRHHGAAGTEIELQCAGDGQFRITRARGRVEVDGTVISEILPRRL